MATVDGKTSIKIDELINGTVVDGELVRGHLILRTRGGAEIDAGVVTGGGYSVLDAMPVGYIYISADATSPATLFGGGTWTQVGQGRVLVGVDPAQTEFNTVGKTGGEKTHTITTSEMPAHTHTIIRKSATGTSTGVARGSASSQADGTTETAGTGVPMNNLQPYLTVYMWQRTA